MRDTLEMSPAQGRGGASGVLPFHETHPGQTQRGPGPGRPRSSGFSRCLTGVPGFPDPGSPLHCVRDDDGKVGVLRMMSARTIRPPQKPCRKILLILRKRAALSRRMGGRVRAVWPILRDEPPGPPQDEGFLFGDAKKDFRPIHSARSQPSTILTGLIGDDIKKSCRPGLEPGPTHHLCSKGPGSGPGQHGDNRAVRLLGQAPARKQEVRR